MVQIVSHATHENSTVIFRASSWEGSEEQKGKDALSSLSCPSETTTACVSIKSTIARTIQDLYISMAYSTDDQVNRGPVVEV